MNDKYTNYTNNMYFLMRNTYVKYFKDIINNKNDSKITEIINNVNIVNDIETDNKKCYLQFRAYYIIYAIYMHIYRSISI